MRDRDSPTQMRRSKRRYELIQAEYSLLEEVELKLGQGSIGALELEGYLCGNTTGFSRTPADQLKIIRDFAREKRVRLPQ